MLPLCNNMLVKVICNSLFNKRYHCNVNFDKNNLMNDKMANKKAKKIHLFTFEGRFRLKKAY